MHDKVELGKYAYKNANNLVELRDTKNQNKIDLIPSVGILVEELNDVEQSLQSLIPGTYLGNILYERFLCNFQSLNALYDIVIIDCPAGMTPYAHAAIRLADHVVTPTVLEEHSLSVLSELLAYFEHVMGMELTTKVSVVMCQVHDNYDTQRRIRSHMNEGIYGYPVVSKSVPYSSTIQDAMEFPGEGNFRNMEEKYKSNLKLLNELTTEIKNKVGVI